LILKIKLANLKQKKLLSIVQNYDNFSVFPIDIIYWNY